VERLRPSRLVIDSLSELRLSMADETRFRRQITAIKHVLTGLGVTTVMLEPSGTAEMDLHLETMTHAVIELDVVPRTYGKERRRLRVVKMREFEYVSGYHDYQLNRTGLRASIRA
jgi:circadian clock protein KaiC